jgi:hypothetical protein
VDHEKSLVAVTKDLQLYQRMFHSESVHSNLALLRLKRKILRELARWNFTASYHGPIDFLRRPSSAKSAAASWCPPEQIRKLFGFDRPLPVATAPRIGYRFDVRANWQ